MDIKAICLKLNIIVFVLLEKMVVAEAEAVKPIPMISKMGGKDGKLSMQMVTDIHGIGFIAQMEI